MWEAYYAEAYANSVKCMYTSVPVHIVDCIGFIWGIYTDIVVSCAHEWIGIYSLYVAFEGILVFDMYMEIMCFISCDADGINNNTIAFFMLR